MLRYGGRVRKRTRGGRSVPRAAWSLASARPRGAARASCGRAVALAWASLIAITAPPAAATDWRLDASALIVFETAVDTGDARFQKAEVAAYPRLELDLPGGAALVGVARVRADAFDRIDPGRPDAPEVARLTRRHALGNHIDWELRELFADVALGPARLTLGKQQVVWGEADGLKVLDLVDPQGFREFILERFDRSRIPLWTVNVEVPIGPTELQLLWVPDPSHHELPEPDGVFGFTSPQLLPPAVPGVVPQFAGIDRPGNAFLDSDAGARLRGRLGGFDLSISYLYQYDDRPVFAGRFGSSAAGPTVSFTQTYERTHVVGLTFANAFGDFTVRGEALARSDRFIGSSDPRTPRLLHETPELAYVLGLDWFGLRDTLLSVQLFQSWLVDDGRALVRDRLDTNVTVFGQHRMLHDRLTLEAIWIHNLNDGDGLVRPRVTYELRDGLDVWLGADVFYGDRRGVFGQFRHADRAVLGLELGL